MDAPKRTEVRAVVFWAGWAGAGAVVGVAFCALWWTLLANDLVPTDHVEELVIPNGTADAIKRGVPFAFVPDQFSFPPGSRLKVVNRDSVQHSIGAADIPAGTSADIEASESGQLVCTIHPSGHLDIALEGRPPVAGMAVVVVLLSLATATVGWVLQ